MDTRTYSMGCYSVGLHHAAPAGAQRAHTPEITNCQGCEKAVTPNHKEEAHLTDSSVRYPVILPWLAVQELSADWLVLHPDQV